MGVLARELTSRGHIVTFYGFPDMRARLAADLRFTAFGKEDQPPGSLQPYLDRLSRVGGIFSIRRLMLDLAGFAQTTCRELPRLLEQEQPDALIIDQTDAAASLVARAVGLAFVTVANALPMNREPFVPPPVLPWSYDPTPRGVRRNLGGYRVASIVEWPVTRIVRHHAQRFGLGHIRAPHETWSDICQITQCVRGLDFPRKELPDHFHYVGPLREPEAALTIDLPETGRPLIFCSLGTLQGSRTGLFRRVARASADLDLDLLIADGGLLPKSEISALPGKPLLHDFVPQRAVLAKCALAVTHCGFNTVLDALSSGTPMVALPITFEQPATGARLARAAVAEVLQHNRSHRRIRTAVERILSDDSYRANAGRLSNEIAQAGGVRLAADLVEQSCGLAVPWEAPTRARSA